MLSNPVYDDDDDDNDDNDDDDDDDYDDDNNDDNDDDDVSGEQYNVTSPQWHLTYIKRLSNQNGFN